MDRDQFTTQDIRAFTLAVEIARPPTHWDPTGEFGIDDVPEGDGWRLLSDDFNIWVRIKVVRESTE